LVGSVTSSLLIVAALDYLLPNKGVLVKMLIAIGLLLVLTLIALKGIEASTAALLVFAPITLLVILTLLVTSLFHLDPANYTPFFSQDKPPLAIFVALFFIFETFVGWEAATFMGGETKNPERTIPKSIMITSLILGFLVIFFPLVILGFVPWQTLVSFETPLTNISFLLFNDLGADLVNVAIFLALIGSAAGGIVATPRLILALAKDKLFIEQLSAVHPKFKTPHKAILFQTLVSTIVIITASGDYQSLLALLIPLAIVMYISIILTVPILRKKYPDQPRRFKAPFGNAGPVIVALFYAGIIVAWLFLVPNSFLLFKKIISFFLFGIPIYALLNLYYNPDLLLRTVNSLAFLNKRFERLIFPKRVRNDVLNIFQELRGKTVLEFGSGVGSFTLPLAEAVGNQGKVYAVDLSPKNVAILVKRLQKENYQHVEVVYDEHFISRVHPDVPRVDMIFSIGNLSYIQDIERVVKDMHSLLPENGQLCLVEYVDYFWGIIPDQPWLDNLEELENMFRDLGFSIRLKKKRGLFWRYLYIYGIKSDYDVPVI
ncbi:amino acid permease, partial [Candidatus Woesearchaeota archaeon]|nr:amino acid permease [Candidatus Woesearchaeota archaeon]